MNTLNDISGVGATIIRRSGDKIINNLLALTPFMSPEELGTKFKEAREEKGFTQQKVADELKVSLRSVQYFEKGEKEWSFSKTITAFELVGYNLTLTKGIIVLK